VALGKTRAKQYYLLKTSPKDCKLGDKVMCVQLHGDASFAGQGPVMETLGLSESDRGRNAKHIDLTIHQVAFRTLRLEGVSIWLSSKLFYSCPLRF
jgi:2-oxoglutarate dehydrogenase complex dehydrogenase (E1) component-like enzyme